MPRARLATLAATATTALLAGAVVGAGTSPAVAASTSYASGQRVLIGQTIETGDGSGMIAINDGSTTVGKALPYPSVAPINGLVGKVSKVVLQSMTSRIDTRATST